MDAECENDAMDATRESAGMEILAKADLVIDALGSAGELSAAQLADSVEEPVSSTYRLLTSLTEMGWVAAGTRRGMYRLGLAFLRIGGMVEERTDVREHALPVLRELLEQTGETSYLCVRRRASAVCIERLDGLAARSLELRLGASLPLAVGAAPRAILAFLTEEERGRLIPDAIAEAADIGHPVDEAVLSRELKRIRRDGYSVSDGDVTTGIGAIGAPIFNHRHELVGAVSVSGVRERLLGDARERTVALVLEGAASISSDLGDGGASS